MSEFVKLIRNRRRVLAPIAGTLAVCGLVSCSAEAGPQNTNTMLPTAVYETLSEGQPNFDAATGLFDSTDTVKSKVDNKTVVQIHRTLGCEGNLLRYSVSIKYGGDTEPVFAKAYDAMICEDEYIGAAEANEMFERFESDPYLGREFMVDTGYGFDQVPANEIKAVNESIAPLSRQNS